VIVPWQLVRVSGPSMVPTLVDGDLVLVRHTRAVRAGDVVLASFRSLPGRLVLKRVAHAVDDGWWLVSDNEFAGGDSRTHGTADVSARVVLRLARGGRMWRSPTRVRRGGRSWDNEVSG
jgi:hypothetical protein